MGSSASGLRVMRVADEADLVEAATPWRAARGVLVAVHGRDRSPEEMVGLLEGLAVRQRLRLLAPRAPGGTWYPDRFFSPLEVNGAGRDAALDRIESLVRMAASRGFSAQRIALAGFSQGGCLTIEYVLGGRASIGAAIAFTGAVMGPDPAARSIAPLTGPGTPLLLTGAREDPWLPEGTFRATEGVLRRAGLDVRSHLFEGAAHIVRPGELSLAEDLLKGHYAGA